MRKEFYFIGLLFFLCYHSAYAGNPLKDKIIKVLKKDILKKAAWALGQQPVTVTAEQSVRSAGGVHDFFSEGDYWWPDPANNNGPYIQKDGLTNPDNFTAHRKAMIRFSQVIGSLTSAYIITKDKKYAAHAITHLSAWFIDEKTFMNPSLLYAQAIKGKVTGRGVGIIDMIQLMEVAQGVRILEKSAAIDSGSLKKIKKWFADYLQWVNTHPYGMEEREAKNNHATCWVMQVAVFAKLVGDQSLMNECKNRFKTILLPSQLEKDGSFPLELKRTKPYGYSLFNLDAMTTICQVLSSKQEDLWDFKTGDGRMMKKAVEFMVPYIEHKESWTYPPDVMYWNDWPVAQPFLLFAYKKYKNKNWFTTWKKLEHFPQTEEVIRNLPVRNPLIWIEE